MVAERSRPARKGATGRILVVDDERVVARVLARVLQSAGHEVLTCFDGISALEQVESANLDVVVSDIAMPGLDGIDLLRAVRARDLDLPVVLITGVPSLETAVQAVEYGAIRYLQKPVETVILRDTVEHAVHLRRVALVRREILETVGDRSRQLADRAGLEVRFERALAQLYVVFQPVVSWTTRTVFAYEAFVRSRETTLTQPTELFDVAERLGKLEELTHRIHELCGQRLGELPEYALLFVNLHINELTNMDHLEHHSPLLGQAGRIVLELTERAKLEQIPDLHPRILRLRDCGFRIALDDIGAGYAGLSSFTLLDPDIVKLDMTLVRDVDSSQTKRRLLSSMLHLCDDLGMQVVAEGVETERERSTLCAMGCDLMQGFLFASPTEALKAPAFCDH